MAAPAPHFRRKNIRLPADRYFGQGFYFLTLCFSDRRSFGANPRVATWLVERLKYHSAACGFHIHAYCVMPDHVHVLAAANREQSNMLKFRRGVQAGHCRRIRSAHEASPLAIQIL